MEKKSRSNAKKIVSRGKGIKGMGVAESSQFLNYLQLVQCRFMSHVSIITKESSKGDLYAKIMSSSKEYASNSWIRLHKYTCLS